jgi:hypothetical protein
MEDGGVRIEGGGCRARFPSGFEDMAEGREVKQTYGREDTLDMPNLEGNLTLALVPA